MMNKNAAVMALLLAVSGLAGGCASGPDAGEEAWSTRAESILASDLKRPELRVYQPVAATTSLSAYRDAAVEILLQAADSSEPLLRANAVEALQAVPQYLEPIVRKGLLDENRGVRFVAAMTVGQQRLLELVPLVEGLSGDGSASVRAAALFALARCGPNTDLTPLAELLFADSAEVRANVAVILGELGNSSAIPMLQSAARRPLNRVEPVRKKIVDLQIAEAMVKLGRETEIEVIHAALFAPADQGELTALACLIVGRLGDRQAMPTLLDMATRHGVRMQPAEIRMAATLAVARLDPSRAPLEVPRAYVASPTAALRAQAAMTLGSTGRADVLGDVGPLLSDADPMVQVAAAGAVLRLRPDSP